MKVKFYDTDEKEVKHDQCDEVKYLVVLNEKFHKGGEIKSEKG